jgi:hypothetical protein
MCAMLQYSTLDELYQFYNYNLFGNILPKCIVSFASHTINFSGIYKKTSLFEKNIHEIQLHPRLLGIPEAEWHPIFVHQMVHVWQNEYDSPSGIWYHNKRWAKKMEKIGLMPSSTGCPGGHKTGSKINQYIIEGGNFSKVFEGIDPQIHNKFKSGFSFKTLINENTDEIVAKKPLTKKTIYICSCGSKITGNADLNCQCLNCNNPFIVFSKKEKTALKI